MPTFSEFVREAVGTAKWIVGRRTPANETRYGTDAVFLSAKEWADLKTTYRNKYPEAA